MLFYEVNSRGKGGHAMGIKVAMIGAGSVVFCKLLMADIMATPALQGSELALMSRTWPKLENMEKFAKRWPSTASPLGG